MSSERLLLVEDDASLGETLKERLEKESYTVSWAQNYRDALAKIKETRYDLVILDVSLPDGSGFDLGKEIRKNSAVPFLFMTALSTAENRLTGYEIGAEEFIPKPFHLKELLLRVRHVLENHAPPENIRCNGITIDFQSQAIVSAGGEKEFLQSRDFRLLKLLVLRAPNVLSRDEILNEIWGEDKFPNHRTVDNAIVRLRQAVNDSEGEMIRSVRGVGYQWVAEKVK